MNAQELIAYREARGLTQAQLAQLAGRTERQVRRWETGENEIPHWLEKVLP